MSTLAQGDTTINISDEILETIVFETVVLDDVGEEFADAVKIELTSTAGTSLQTETTGSTVLSGESLQGTAEDPASISLVTDDSGGAQFVSVDTATITNTVITTEESVNGSTVAAATIVLSSEEIESVSIKVASTAEKSEISFDQSTESLDDVQIEMEGAGGTLDIQSAQVESLKVKAAGEQFSEIKFGADVEKVNNAQIEFGESGGSLEMEGGTLSASTISIATSNDVVNSVAIGSSVESVSDTTLELSKGSSNIDISSNVVENVSVVASSKKPTSLEVDSADVSGFTLSVARSTANLSLDSDNKIEGTTLDSSTKGNFAASIDAANKDTAISNKKGGDLEASFNAKTINPTISNSGKGTVEANFSSTVRGASIESSKGPIEASFSGKSLDIVVDASTSKAPVDLSFDSKATNVNLSLGKGSDEIIFGGKISGSSSVDLGSDKKEDTISINKSKKVIDPLEISNFGKQDLLSLGSETYSYKAIKEFYTTESFPISNWSDIIVLSI